MYLRCSRCHEPTWLRSLVPGLVESPVRCQDCGHEHDVSRSAELGETGKEQYTNANEFSRRNGVDLPTAYSILLGLMTLQEVRDEDAAQREKQREANAPAVETPVSDDPVFPPEEPGSQDDLALEIPESLLGELEAQDESSFPVAKPEPRKRRSRPAAPGRRSNVTIQVERESAPRRSLTWGQLALVSVLAILTIGFSGRYAFQKWRGMVEEGRAAKAISVAAAKAQASADEKVLEETRSTQPTVPAALQPKIERDANGRVLYVIGPNPLTVLEAYCEVTSGTYKREPLELAQATPPDPGERFGIFRDFARLEYNHAIRISLDNETNRWIAGNGRGPVATRKAPEFPDTITTITANAPD